MTGSAAHPASTLTSLTRCSTGRAARCRARGVRGGQRPDRAWFLDPLRAAVDRGVTVVVTTQCRAGSVVGGLYATGSALLATGAISGGDMTFEAALTKLMVLAAATSPTRSAG